METATHTVRCDIHHRPMQPTLVIYLDLADQTPGFRCDEPGCLRHFVSGRGYLDVVDRRPLEDKFQQRCPVRDAAVSRSNCERNRSVVMPHATMQARATNGGLAIPHRLAKWTR